MRPLFLRLQCNLKCNPIFHIRRKYTTNHKLIPNLWPKNLKYVTNPVSYINEKCSEEEEIPLMRDHFEIRKVEKGHPAYSPSPNEGFGLFCIKPIKKNSILGQYVGEIKYENYSMTYSLQLDYHFIDAEHCGNELRMINDFRGIGEKNVKFDGIYINDVEKGIVKSIKDINLNEEILLDYGKDYWFKINEDDYGIRVALWSLRERRDVPMALEMLERMYKKGKLLNSEISQLQEILQKYIKDFQKAEKLLKNISKGDVDSRI